MTSDNHFIDRCRERGLGHVAEGLYWDLRKALACVEDGAHLDGQYIEKVFALPEADRAIYRFCVDGDIFYTIVAQGRSPITLITADMIHVYRRQRRNRRGNAA